MVTAVELARRLDVDPRRLRSWLRRKAAAGHPFLGNHVDHGRWEFTEEEADQLAADFGSPDGSKIASPSAHQAGSPTTVTRRRSETARRDRGAGHRIATTWRGEAMETLEDLLRPGLRAVCVGINPSPISVAAGHYYQGRVGRRFWARLRQTGVLDEASSGFEDDAAFASGIGFTDIVKRPTARADGLSAQELEHGRAELREKLLRCRPRLVVFTFKKTAVALLGPFDGYGHSPELHLAGIPTFVMPGPYERGDLVAAAMADLRRIVGADPL